VEKERAGVEEEMDGVMHKHWTVVWRAKFGQFVIRTVTGLGIDSEW